MKKEYNKTHIRDAKIISNNISFDTKTLTAKLTYEIRMNQKTRRWMCNCQSACYNVDKYCKHILAFLYKYDRNAFHLEIKESIINKPKQSKIITECEVEQ